MPIDQCLSELAPIAERNFSSKRFRRLKENQKKHPGLTPTRYIDLLIGCWLMERDRIRRLEQKDREEWEKLQQNFAAAAARMLSHYPINSSSMTADDFAVEACIKIFNNRYPFDVPFEAWTGTILKNLVFERSRSKDALDKPHESLDDVRPNSDTSAEGLPLASRIEDKTAEFYSQLEDSDLLMRVLRQLRSGLEREVIQLTYLSELSDEKIAQKLDKTKANVQTIRHRALVQLSYLLEELQVKESARRKHNKK